MLDDKFTKDIQAFVSLPDRTEDDIRRGAELLLRINRNQALYQQIFRRPRRMEEKLVYELNKHLKYRLDGLTLQEVRRMNRDVTEKVDRLLSEPEKEKTGSRDTAKTLGRRPDHDSLPAEIRQLWDDNAERWKKMKETRASIELLTMACDRYEYLKALDEMYTRYKTDMARYDSYNPEDRKPEPSAEVQVSSARAYISKNRKKYEQLVQESPADATQLWNNIRQRVEVLRKFNAAMSDDLKEWLKANGIAPSDSPRGGELK